MHRSLLDRVFGVDRRIVRKHKQEQRQRKLRLESLEERALLAADVFFNDNWHVFNDVGPVGLSVGDEVDGSNDGLVGTTGVYGVDAFGAVTTGAPGSLAGSDTLNDAVAATDVGGTLHVLPGTYNENVTINKNIAFISTNGRAATTIDGNDAGGELGTVFVTNNTTGVEIGRAGQGFTIIGIDGTPGLEKAAIYFQGSHSNAQIRDNEIQARGDSGLITEFGATISGFVIDGNEFSGQSFDPPGPAGIGFGTQFTQPNVPRQLVVMGGGTGGGNTSNITFTNNDVTGTAGGISTDDGVSEQGNTLVMIDSVGATITGNTFAGTTTRFGSSLRSRGSSTAISGNSFISAGQSPTTNFMFLLGSGGMLSTDPTTIEQVIDANTFDQNLVVIGAQIGFTPSIQGVIDAVSPGVVLLFDGNFNESVNVNKALTVGGDFSLTGSLTASVPGATLGAGFSPGIIASAGLTLTVGSILDVEVDGTTPGTQHDQYVVTGAVDLGGATLNAFGTITAATGDQVVFIDNDGGDAVVGQFAGLADGDTVVVNGENFKIFYNGGDGNDVVLIRDADSLPLVVVDDSFAGTTPGADPDGAGPAMFFGIDSFTTIQEGVDAVDAGGTIIVNLRHVRRVTGAR